jgi:hypothetical protein
VVVGFGAAFGVSVGHGVVVGFGAGFGVSVGHGVVVGFGAAFGVSLGHGVVVAALCGAAIAERARTTAAIISMFLVIKKRGSSVLLNA